MTGSPSSVPSHATTLTEDLTAAIKPFQAPSRRDSLAQLTTSMGGFIGVCAAMYAMEPALSAFTLLLVPLAAGFLVRIFIIQHDCGHGAFFRSQRANDVVGFLCSLLTLAPYASWSRQHAGHHGVWNDLDRRDRGVDIYSTCLTVAEYQALSRWGKIQYRLTRHPVVTCLLLPPVIFFLLYRLPFDMPPSWKRERRALLLTNIGLVVLYGGVGLSFGFATTALVSVPVMILASIIGVWLFSVQHRFEGTYWARHDRWNETDAALRGSSYLKLPRVLQWFTGNIGFHHLHHLNTRIPNYRLRECHESTAGLTRVRPLTLWRALRAPSFLLWDEERQAMVSAG
jgi:omega-6 fatty acid desaturase (delta-12 desaturase)